MDITQVFKPELIIFVHMRE